MDASRLEREARALFDVRDFEWSGHAEVDGHRGFYQACPSCGGLRPDMAPSSLKNLHGHGKRCRLVALRAALAAQPAQAGGGDACCLFCRTELDPDEMDDGSDLPPLAPGVCSECFQRWHDEPVWRKRLKEATDKPAQAGEAVAWAGVQALIDAADKCADLMDAQECPVSSGGEEWDAALCELRERADALRAARINAWSPAPSRPGGASQSAPDAALLERVARETVHLCLDLYDNCINVRRDREGLIARAIATAKGGAP